MHLAGCPDCAALVSDLRKIVRGAGDLPLLSPQRDLWSGIEARIEAPVVALPTRSAGTAAAAQEVMSAEAAATPAVIGTAAAAPRATTPVPPRPLFAAVAAWRRYAIAASLLVAVTAGVTYVLTARTSGAVAGRDTVATAPAAGAGVLAVSRSSATETFDREIASLRRVVDDRRNELDPVTLGIVEKNLKVIDHAIAESKAALANDPSNAFLSDRLTYAYDAKLQLLRELATRPPRS
jgi:phage tail sheath gpL-like